MNKFILSLLLFAPLLSSAQTVETKAEYPGGIGELYKFIKLYTCYPESMQTAKIEGTTYVEILIDTAGKATLPKVTKSIHKDFDDVCLGVFEFMPKWKAATKNGKKVKSKFVLPITFKLADATKKVGDVTPQTCAELEAKKEKARK